MALAMWVDALEETFYIPAKKLQDGVLILG
jgi:hypothetical protein